METGLPAYLCAFKHVPLWWWFIGLLLVSANVIILHPKTWKGLTDKPSCHASGVTPRIMQISSGDSKAYFRTKGWKNRLNGFYTRSFREYSGSTNGWIKNEGSLS
jgi:hypothetical protein